MEVSCECELESEKTCKNCPITLNKESILKYLESQQRSKNLNDLVKSITMDLNNITGSFSPNGFENPLYKMFESGPDMQPGYIGRMAGCISSAGESQKNKDEKTPTQKNYNVYFHGTKVGSVACYKHVKGPEEHWFLTNTGEIDTKMSLTCDVEKE